MHFVFVPTAQSLGILINLFAMALPKILARSELILSLFFDLAMRAAMALQKVLEYMLRNEKARGPKGQKTIHHCFRSLLEVMVDLKELLESSDSDESDSESESAEDDEEDESDEVRGSSVIIQHHGMINVNNCNLFYQLSAIVFPETRTKCCLDGSKMRTDVS